jgi:hypothetical protein
MDTNVLTEHAPEHPHAGRRRRSRDLPVVAAASFLALAVVLALVVLYTNGPGGRVAASPARGPVTSSDVEIVGVAPGGNGPALEFDAVLPDELLALGQPGRLAVEVTNPSDRVVVLDTLAVTVTGASDPRCRTEWLSVSPYDARRDRTVTVDPRGTSSVVLPFELTDLARVNQDSCKGARFSLAITGSGHAV